MKLNLDEIKLAINFENILNKRNLYILGAGVSANYIKPNYYLLDQVKNSLTKQGGFPIGEGMKLTQIDQNRLIIIGSKIPIIDSEPNYGLAELLQHNLDIFDVLAHKYPWHAALICAKNYSLDTYPSKCPEYSIFNFAHSSSVIVSMNHDSLASNFIRNKKIISLHGEIPPESKKYIKTLLTLPMDVDITQYLPKDLYLATREFESELIFSDKYVQLMNILINEKFENIVIIGYSFFKRDAQHIYDEFTFEIINNYLYENKCGCIIIDMDPSFVNDFIPTKTMPQTYAVNWGSFIYSYMITKALKNSQIIANNFSEEDARRFLEYYSQCTDIFSQPNNDDINTDEIINRKIITAIYNHKNKSYSCSFNKNAKALVKKSIITVLSFGHWNNSK